MSKLVSVIIPVYNVEKYLKKCLNSVLKQTYNNCEIIIVNDGSLDNSQSIIENYAKKHKRIKYFIKSNGGLSDARNYGLSKAKGEYIAFLDSDDYFEKDMIETMIKYMEKENYDIVFCDINNVYENNNIKKVYCNYNLSSEMDKNYLMSAPMACNKIYKRNVFDNDFMFKKGVLYEDLELIPSLVIKTTKIGYVDKSLYNYYQRSGSIMKQKKFNPRTDDIFLVLDSMVERFKKYNKFEIYKNEIEYLFIEHLLYSASLRFISFNKVRKAKINIILTILKEKYPNWKNNKYYQKKSIKFKLVCNLVYYKQFSLLNILNKLK